MNPVTYDFETERRRRRLKWSQRWAAFFWADVNWVKVIWFVSAVLCGAAMWRVFYLAVKRLFF